MEQGEGIDIQIRTVKVWEPQNELQYLNKQINDVVFAPQNSIILKWTLSFKILFTHSSFVNSPILDNFRIPSYGYPGDAGHLARWKKMAWRCLMIVAKGAYSAIIYFFGKNYICWPPLKSEIPF